MNVFRGLMFALPWSLLLWALILFPLWAQAHHHYSAPPAEPEVTNVTNVTEVTEVGISERDLAEALAYSAAVAQTNFDLNTLRTQLSLGGGFYDDETAINLAIGKKFKKDGIFFNGSIGTFGDKAVVGFGGTVKF